MTQPDAELAVRLAVDHVHAVRLEDGRYAYYASETRAWYLVTEADLLALGTAMIAAERDAYSFWCQGCGQEVMESDHDLLDQIHAATAPPGYL
jgi:hypothetical protein